MPTVGPNSPSGSGQTVTSLVDWSNVANVESSNDARASVTLTTQPSEQLYGENFGFSIPLGSTIDTVQVEIEGQQDVTAAGKVPTFFIGKGALIYQWQGANPAFNLGADAYQSRSGAVGTDWGSAGSTLSAAEVNASTFRAGCNGNEGDGSGVTFQVDHIRVTITYTPPKSGLFSIQTRTFRAMLARSPR